MIMIMVYHKTHNGNEHLDFFKIVISNKHSEDKHGLIDTRLHSQILKIQIINIIITNGIVWPYSN